MFPFAFVSVSVRCLYFTVLGFVFLLQWLCMLCLFHCSFHCSFHCLLLVAWLRACLVIYYSFVCLFAHLLNLCIRSINPKVFQKSRCLPVKMPGGTFVASGKRWTHRWESGGTGSCGKEIGSKQNWKVGYQLSVVYMWWTTPTLKLSLILSLTLICADFGHDWGRWWVSGKQGNCCCSFACSRIMWLLRVLYFLAGISGTSHTLLMQTVMHFI